MEEQKALIAELRKTLEAERNYSTLLSREVKRKVEEARREGEIEGYARGVRNAPGRVSTNIDMVAKAFEQEIRSVVPRMIADAIPTEYERWLKPDHFRPRVQSVIDPNTRMINVSMNMQPQTIVMAVAEESVI